MNILLATPTYSGLGPEYVASMMRLQRALGAQGIRSRNVFNSMAEVARSRNALATHFWESPELTHLLFVDSDMSFEPSAVDALIRARRPLVGAVYPKRKLDLERFAAEARRQPDTRLAIAAALEWVVVPGSESAEVADGLCKVDGLGMGLCLIARDVFARMLEAGPISRDPTPHATLLHKGPALGFFDTIQTDQGLVPEDLAFCRRWRQCGGDVWAMLDQEIGHVGSMVFRGRCLDALMAGAERQPPEAPAV
jgi:hypothetical protein